MNERPAFSRLAFRAEHGLAVLLFAATLALFWPARGYDYSSLDDYFYVADNPTVAGGLSWEGAKQAFTTVHEQWWLPLLWISYMGDVEAFGAGPQGHHLVNILLHASNAALLFWALFRMTGSRWRSAFAAALFAWHPLRVEAVAWIAARKDVMSGFFFMLCLLAYVRQAERPSGRRMAWVVALMLAGLMSKAILIVVPFLLLLLDFWPLRRAQALWGAAAWAEWRPRLREKIPLFGLAAAFAAVNLWTHVSGRGAGDVSWWDRLGLMAPNVFAYLGKIAVPARLTIFYPENDRVSWLPSLAAAGTLLLATAGLFREREKRPYLLVGWLWFLLGLAPIVRGVRLGFAQYADRFTYLPLIGLGIALAWLGGEWARGRARRWVPAAGALILAACLARTHAQLPWWRNNLALFQRAAYLAPGHPLVHSHYGQALYETGRVAEAEEQLREALRLQPANGEYLSIWGMALLRLGRAEEALAAHDKAIAAQPGVARYHNNRGNALAKLGREEEARAAFEEALRLLPGCAQAHYNLGNLLSRSGRAQEALPHYEAAVRGRPDLALFWYNLGVAYAQLGRPAEALPCVARALQIDPNLPDGNKTLARLRLLAF